MPAKCGTGNLGPLPCRSGVIRVLQLSDPHLLADPQGLCRGRPALALLRHGWQQALTQIGGAPDLLLLSGDLCQDESWGGYARLRDWLQEQLLPLGVPVALLPGNHDHPLLLQAALGRQAWLAPAAVSLGGWTVLTLNSHRAGCLGGWLEPAQLAWLDQQLSRITSPVLVALHHPPLPIGSSSFDGIALQQPEALLDRLLAHPQVRALVFGHVHQHWQGQRQRPAGAPPLRLWGCPSTLAAFPAVQPCPLGQPDWPGGRLLELQPDGEITTRLLRWSLLPAA